VIVLARDLLTVVSVKVAAGCRPVRGRWFSRGGGQQTEASIPGLAWCGLHPHELGAALVFDLPPVVALRLSAA
jgi:hypothetical protein